EPTPSKSNADATTMPAGLPTGREAIVAHLSGYKGVGVKSAEGLYDAFGESTFEVLRNERERVSEVLGPRRSATVLAQWEADYAERISAQAATAEAAPAAEAPAAKKPASRGRGRGGGRGGAKKATAEAAKTEKQAEQPAE